MSIFKNIVAAGLSVAILATPMVSSFRTNADAETPETTISETTTSEISEQQRVFNNRGFRNNYGTPTETTTEQTTATVSAPVQTAKAMQTPTLMKCRNFLTVTDLLSVLTRTQALSPARLASPMTAHVFSTFTSETDYNAAIAYFDANAIFMRQTAKCLCAETAVRMYLREQYQTMRQ